MFSAQRLNSLQMNRFLTQSVTSVHSQPQSHETSRWTRVCQDVVQVLGRQNRQTIDIQNSDLHLFVQRLGWQHKTRDTEM